MANEEKHKPEWFNPRAPLKGDGVNEGKHAPEPWRVDKHVHGYNLVRPGRLQECVTIYPEADARLIAAAPEMLAALRAVDAASALTPGDCYTTEGQPNANWGRMDRALSNARAAIAKATEGREE